MDDRKRSFAYCRHCDKFIHFDRGRWMHAEAPEFAHAAAPVELSSPTPLLNLVDGHYQPIEDGSYVSG